MVEFHPLHRETWMSEPAQWAQRVLGRSAIVLSIVTSEGFDPLDDTFCLGLSREALGLASSLEEPSRSAALFSLPYSDIELSALSDPSFLRYSERRVLVSRRMSRWCLGHEGDFVSFIGIAESYVRDPFHRQVAAEIRAQLDNLPHCSGIYGVRDGINE